jgi:hypothetical protein
MNYGLITIDYEDHLQAIEQVNPIKNVISPTYPLMQFLQRFHIPATFFIDMAEYLYAERHSIVVLNEFKFQFKEMVKQNFSLQLHFHPQWLFREWHAAEKKYVDTQNVEIGLNEIDLSTYELELTQCKKKLEHYNPVVAYRAGGYKIKPFSKNFPVLQRLGIQFDSSIQTTNHPTPYEIWDGIWEIPIGYLPNGVRWDLSGSANSVLTIMQLIELYRKQEKDSYFIMMGHVKHPIQYEKLTEVLTQLQHQRNFKFITFADIRL